MLVSRLPFIRLFQALLSLIAPEYFDKLVPCLEAGEWSARASSSSWGAQWPWQAAPTGQAPDPGPLDYSVQ